MRIRIAIHPKTGELTLPKHYQRPLSAAIWKKINLPQEKEGTQPKLICFSSLLFQQRETTLKSDKIRLCGNSGSLLIASPLQNILDAISEISGEITIAGNLADLGKKQLLDNPDFQEEMTWKTLPGSGICVRETFPDGAKGRSGLHLFPQKDKEKCQTAIQRALTFKYRYLCEKDSAKAIRWCENENLTEWGEKNPPQIEILQNLGYYRENIREDAEAYAWPATIKITGHTTWQRLAWDSGLGIRTGLGFGMVEPLNK